MTSRLFSSVSKENFSAGDMPCVPLSIVSLHLFLAVGRRTIIELMFVFGKRQVIQLQAIIFLQESDEKKNALWDRHWGIRGWLLMQKRNVR